MDLPIKIKLPDGFLEEEVRCGYTVSEEMKEVWAVELDLLNEFDEICKKNNIEYIACGGTILGAVRHKGFIPWDDDIDLMLSRKNYNKLLQIRAEFNDPYFFQTEENDSGSLRGHAQLRNSKTTGILKGEYDQNHTFNQGIFIDIFPLDNLPDNEMERKAFIKRCKKMKELSQLLKYGMFFRRNCIAFIADFFRLVYLINRGETSKTLYDKFEESAQKYNNDITRSCTLVCSDTINHIYVYDNSDLGDIKEVQFENMLIPIPTNYDKVLTLVYGDWKKFMVGQNDHGDIIFDTRKSYLEYIKAAPKNKRFKPWFFQ